MLQSEKLKQAAPVIVRIGVSLVFLWFGSEQTLHPEMWTGFIPDWALQFSGVGAGALIYFNGYFEIFFGGWLLLGFFTRLSAFLLAIHLFNIAFTIGYNDVGVRDFGLAMATFSVFLKGADIWCLDRLFKL